MKAKLHLVFTITIFLVGICGHAQTGYWKPLPTKAQTNANARIASTDQNVGYFVFEETVFAKDIQRITRDVSATVFFPDKNGRLKGFSVKETPVFHPELSKKYPQIKSFTGWSADKKTKIRFSTSHVGIQAMTIDLENGQMGFVQKTDQGIYKVYDKKDGLTAKDGFVCRTLAMGLKKTNISKALVDDQVLRRFRIAVSTTGEYTTYHGGTVADALAAINATLTRVNEVFETDLGVTLELIANNDEVIFTDSTSDPYNGNLNAQVQSTLTTTIGEANYDVGHLFHRDNDNGNAGFIGSVCVDGRKGSAFSSALTPEGDNFDLDFVSHELGHQFGANHTWSFESEGTGVQAEPASGTTIMGYAGIVEGNNVAPNGDDYFHYYSILQITDYLQTVTCAETAALTNNPPSITPISDFVIPKGTAFVLTATATDPDVGDVLTYAWEQVDNGVVTTSTFGPENPSGANFRSLPPTTDRNRYFPRLSEVVQGNLTQTQPATNSAWETVSNIQRELNFVLTVRDNAAGGGQVVTDLVKIDVEDAAGPFAVTSQTSNETYQAGSTQQVTWDVANTNLAPINAETVDIFLSLDGGTTFPLFLAEDLPNTGSADVLLPGNATTEARFMVKASNNVFFAVNSTDFTIEETEVVLDFPGLDFEACQPSDVDISFTYKTYGGFSEESTFSADAPPGLTVTFSPTTATADDTPVLISITDTGAVAEGSYPLTITATSATVTQEVVLNLSLYDTTFDAVTLTSPTDGELNTAVNPLFEWQAEVSATAYDLEIATDDAFTAIVETATVATNRYKSTSLEPQTNYFWRVRPKNNCGEGVFSTALDFTTIQIDCKNLSAVGLPAEISPQGTPEVTSTITFLEDLVVADVNVGVSLTHSFVEDLIISLTSPSGTTVVLTSKNCGSQNNIDAIFDDDGTVLVCGGTPAISGTVQPVGVLEAFNGESLLGDWVLTVQDTAPSDGGALADFSLEVCAEGAFRPDDDEDGVFDDGDDLCLGTPKGVAVDTNGCALNDFAVDNFLITVSSETCRNNNNGQIEITASDESIDYTATLSGDGVNETVDFTDTGAFQNLASGQYSLCITGTDGTINFRERCFEINIEEPEVLTVSTTLVADQKKLIFNLNGGNLYNIEINGLLTQTTASEIMLDLKEGQNNLKVSTNLPCQGTYEEEILLFGEPVLYPNPVSTTTNIYFADDAERVNIAIYSVNGRLIRTEKVSKNGNVLSMDFGGLPPGVYYIRASSANQSKVLKMLKQ
ncbi:reprolysin-like metallopeptidase [Allomuricauda sp. d1]|uniref:reprolysin-like metallopeptidase n=1 Tax=Allomuricauda sp. d1 TaxID=3136725 RepID=UPI0031D22243